MYDQAYVVMGPVASSVDIADVGFPITISRDSAFTTVSGAGDLDGDGMSDFLLADMGYHDDYTGRVWVYHGPVEGPLAVDDAEEIWDGGGGGEQAGASVTAARDLNGDGLDDFLIGAPGYVDEVAGVDGAVYVVPGE
jgi:hypothetical protein